MIDSTVAIGKSGSGKLALKWMGLHLGSALLPGQKARPSQQFALDSENNGQPLKQVLGARRVLIKCLLWEDYGDGGVKERAWSFVWTRT